MKKCLTSDFVIQHQDPRKSKIHYQVDYEHRIVTILDGEVKTKEEFLALHKRSLFFMILNQIAVEKDGCVNPNAYNIIKAIKNNETDHAYMIADAWYHSLDNFDIVIKLK